MPDIKATADAIAARFVGATTTTGETFAQTPTSSLPNAINAEPVCFVYPPSGVLDVGMSRIRNDELDFPVRILIEGMERSDRSDRLYAWYNATRDLVEGQISLGLSYVSWARLTAVQMHVDGWLMAGTVYDLIEYTVRVHYGDQVSTLAL